MHEMSLAEGVRSIVEDAAQAQGCARVALVVLEIGELAAVEVEALRFCLEIVLQDGVAAGAAVEIQSVPGVGWCDPCGVEVPLHQRQDPCPLCARYGVRPTGGLALRVKELALG